MAYFTYYTPTKVLFGRGVAKEIGPQLKERGAKKALIHYGGGSVVRSGLLATVKRSLDEAGIAWVELGGAVPNPRLSLVYKGIDLVKAEGVDFLVAIGGGSAIDSAKAIGYGVAGGGDVWDFYTKKRVPAASMPLAVIPTLAATGTEMSNSSVITNEDGWLKRAVNSDLGRPALALMDPELTVTLPAYQTFSGATDIMMHTLERYLNGVDTNLDLTDSIAEGLLRTVMHYAHVLQKNPTDYKARAEIMWAGSLSHNGLTGFCTDNGDWMTHKIEHELGGMFDVTHGAGLAAIWGSWARYVIACHPDRFAKLAVNVLGVEPGASDEETGRKGIEAMEDFFRSINMPTSLKELGVDPTEEQILEMAEKCAEGVGGVGGSMRKLRAADIAEILRMAANR